MNGDEKGRDILLPSLALLGSTGSWLPFSGIHVCPVASKYVGDGSEEELAVFVRVSREMLCTCALAWL